MTKTSIKKPALIAIALIVLSAPAIAQSGIPGVLAPGVSSELVQEGFVFTEGPLGAADGSLYFSDIRANNGVGRTHLLDATGKIPKFQVPVWVVLLSASAIAFGTYAGGWRIIRTLGWRIYKLDPATGMAAQLTGAAVIQVATQFGLPVSTTHVITGTVMGAGASQRLSALRWGVGANILTAWVFTIPAAALTAWVAYAVLHTAGLSG